MSRPLTSPRGKAGFQSAFNASMYMSNASLAKVQSKIDKERARHEQEIKMLDKIEKAELRLAQRELEEVKRELHTLKAYKLVAKQTAFKKFDRLELKKRERREKQRQAREKALQESKEKEEMVNSELGEDPHENSKMAAKRQERRRSSNSGEVFVTLRDILENDDVLRRHSQEIVQQRLTSLVNEDDEDDENERDCESIKKSRVRTWLDSTTRRSSNNRQDKGMSKGLHASIAIENNTREGERTDEGDTKNIQDDSEQRFGERPFRKSKIGSVGNLVENVIREEAEAEKQEETEKKEEGMEDGQESVYQCDDGETREIKSLVVSGRKGFKMDKFSNGFFITASQDESESENRIKTRKSTSENRGTSTDKLRPMTLFEISKMYEAKKAQKLEENENKLMNLQRRKAQKEYEQFRFKLQQRDHQRQQTVSQKHPFTIPHSSINDEEETSFSKDPLNTVGHQPSMKTTNSLENDKAIPSNSLSSQNEIPEITSMNSKSMPMPSSAPLCSLWSTVSRAASAKKEAASGSTLPTASSAPVKGLARFRNAAAAVSVNQRVSQGVKGSDRMKNLAAAIMIKNKTTKGRVSHSFLSGGAFSWTSPSDDTKAVVSPLEASHKNPNDVRIHPLQMPLRVQEEQEKKWGELMLNVQYAVYWKVKALREDTGTLSSRQMRRLVRDRPPQRSALFPGDCKTTWAMKKYVKEEVGDVLKSWRPENLRKKRSQKLIDKISLPQFVDRVRTTTSILRSFRLFKTRVDGKDAEQLGHDDDDDEVRYNELEERNYNSWDTGKEKEEGDNTTNVIGQNKEFIY